MEMFAIEEFTARRRASQEAIEAELIASTREALKRFEDGDENWFKDLLLAVRDQWRKAYSDQTGHPPRTDVWTVFRRAVVRTLRKTVSPTEDTPVTLAIWLATAIQNSATTAAALHDEEHIVLEWVTMHDNSVRHTHQEVEGEERDPGQTFTVGGEQMPYPGYPGVSIELWINCRCALRAHPASEEKVAAALFVSDKPWDGSASRFTPAQWKSSCVLHVCDGEEKSCHKLPIKEPGGALSRAGVHAAAGRINQVDAPSDAVSRAKASLRSAYKELGEDPPDSIAASTTDDENRAILSSDTEGDIMADDETNVAPQIAWHGVLAPEGVMSGDKRMFNDGSLSFRNLPLPLTWQERSDDGHDGSVVVARIDSIERVDNLMHAHGVFLQTPEADKVVGLIAEFGRFGVSVDADEAEFDFDEESESLRFTKARIASASIVSIPAFQEAWIALGPWPVADGEEEVPALAASTPFEGSLTFHSGTLTWNASTTDFRRGPGWITDPVATKRIHDYWTVPGEEGYIKIGWGTPGDFNRCRVLVGEKIAENSPEDVRFLNQICAQWHHDALGIWPGEHHAAADSDQFEGTGEALELVASVKPAPAAWFANPDLDRLTPITVTDEGQVFGHLAGWETCHTGFKDTCVAPPQSASDYAYFLTGEVVTDAGRIPVGNLTIGGGHAGPGLSARAALSHYDSTSAVVADVTCGEDEHGIWLAGWVRPGVPDEMVVALRASALSGDWRRIGGTLELIAALAVNSPGFPIPRVAAGIKDAAQMSLVAAGVVRQEGEQPNLDVESIALAVVRHLSEITARRERMAALAARVGAEV